MIKIKVLLLPKIDPEESRIFKDEWLQDADIYYIKGTIEGKKFYVKNGVALFATSEGKINASQGLTCVLLDNRFDFSDCYIISVGCAGGTTKETTLGDVIIDTAAVDFDFGHTADIREFENKNTKVTHFVEGVYKDFSCVIFDQDLQNRVFELTKNTKLETTEKALNFIKTFVQDVKDPYPKIKKGTTVTGDNYWKGFYPHLNAEYKVSKFDCPDPFALSEMEDLAFALVAKRFNMLNRFIAIRTIVNFDIFINGATPENLWTEGNILDSIGSEDNVETCGIFNVAMKNELVVVKKVVNAILNKEL